MQLEFCFRELPRSQHFDAASYAQANSCNSGEHHATPCNARQHCSSRQKRHYRNRDATVRACRSCCAYCISESERAVPVCVDVPEASLENHFRKQYFCFDRLTRSKTAKLGTPQKDGITDSTLSKSRSRFLLCGAR